MAGRHETLRTGLILSRQFSEWVMAARSIRRPYPSISQKRDVYEQLC
jgi:hypothetical protein